MTIRRSHDEDGCQGHIRLKLLKNFFAVDLETWYSPMGTQTPYNGFKL